MQISPSSPEHTNYYCFGEVPVNSQLPMSDLSMVYAPTQNMSSISSTYLRSPHSPSFLGLPLFPMTTQSCTSQDRDLSHLDHCLHHTVRRRTSSPVLMDRNASQPGSRHGNVTMYLKVNNTQSLESSHTPHHKALYAPVSVFDGKVGQDFS